MTLSRLSLLFALIAAPTLGCDDHDHEHAHGEDPVEEACEHAVDGPFADVTAAEADSAPAIQRFEHTRVDVTLASGADGNGGAVAFNVSEAGDYTFFLTADVPVAFSDDMGSIEIEATAVVDVCDAVATSHTVELPAGEVIITFGPTEESAVGVIFEAIEHADHE